MRSCAAWTSALLRLEAIGLQAGCSAEDSVPIGAGAGGADNHAAALDGPSHPMAGPTTVVRLATNAIGGHLALTGPIVLTVVHPIPRAPNRWPSKQAMST